jgi:hypothetical protein
MSVRKRRERGGRYREVERQWKEERGGGNVRSWSCK